MFNSLLPNILAKKFYLGSKKKAKGALYACNIDHIPVKRTEEVKGKTNNNQFAIKTIHVKFVINYMVIRVYENSLTNN